MPKFDLSAYKGNPKTIVKLALALKAWRLFSEKDRIILCPFLGITGCTNVQGQRNGQGVCHVIYPEMSKHQCARSYGNENQLLRDAEAIERDLWRMADHEYQYNFRKDRVARAKDHGYDSIIECTIDLYQALRATSAVAERLGVGNSAIGIELQRFGIQMMPRGGYHRRKEVNDGKQPNG